MDDLKMQKQTLKKAYKKTKRKHITPWKILAIICAVVTIVSIPLSILLQKFDNSMAARFGGSFWKLQNEDTNAQYYTSDFNSAEEMVNYGLALTQQVEAEGAALLMNNNNALPLAADAKVSTFSSSSVNLVYGGTGSGNIDASTADTLRPALQILKTAPGTKLVSAFFVMCTDTPQFGTDGTLIFADCGLNINPSSDELSEIAIASAHSWSTFMGNVEPHVAMLSYSTMGSAGGEVAKKVQEAVKFCKEKAPELAIDGDLQLDAAIVPTVAQLKAPGSSVAGKANVLVFPDLEAGNIGYKLVQRFAGADAYGPILQGIAKPVNDLSRGCSADDIVGVVAITAVQAQMAE